MRNHWSLVLFTLLIQSAAGCMWCALIVSQISLEAIGLPYLKHSLVTSLVVSLVGLSVAMGHLGKPFNSLHAARNIKGSWLRLNARQ